MKQIHNIQLSILKKLLFANGLRFSEIKPRKKIENNQFVFHLNQMISAGYIEKIETRYFLTKKGKEFANRMDTDKTTIANQAKISVVIVPMKGAKSDRQFLIYTRLKQPFYGCQGFMSGKVNYGEKIEETAMREFKEETNLEGSPKLVAIKHYRVYDQETKDLLEDKFMFFCKVENPTGDLVPAKEGNYEWIKRKDLKKYVTNHFESFDTLLEDINSAELFDGSIQYIEKTQYSEKF